MTCAGSYTGLLAADTAVLLVAGVPISAPPGSTVLILLPLGRSLVEGAPSGTLLLKELVRFGAFLAQTLQWLSELEGECGEECNGLVVNSRERAALCSLQTELWLP